MRFVVGLLLGLGLGFAGALLLAPRRDDRQEALEEGVEEQRDALSALRAGIEDARKKAGEAMREARQAAREAEEEMRERYRRQAKLPREP